MKYLLTLLFTLMVLASALAQRIEVSEGKSLKVNISDQVSTPLKVKNLTSEAIDLIIRRVDKNIGSTQKSYFCLDGNCFDSDTDQLPVQYTIPAGETSLEFETILESGLVAGYSTIKYIIYDRNFPTEAIEYELSYSVEEQIEKQLIYDTDDLRINDFYPNPVSEYAIIDYNLNNKNIEAKIVIHNVLGSVMGEYQLQYLERKLVIKTNELNAGVYFYTLYIDNDGVLSRKIIVRK